MVQHLFWVSAVVFGSHSCDQVFLFWWMAHWIAWVPVRFRPPGVSDSYVSAGTSQQDNPSFHISLCARQKSVDTVCVCNATYWRRFTCLKTVQNIPFYMDVVTMYKLWAFSLRNLWILTLSVYYLLIPRCWMSTFLPHASWNLTWPSLLSAFPRGIYSLKKQNNCRRLSSCGKWLDGLFVKTDICYFNDQLLFFLQPSVFYVELRHEMWNRSHFF